MHDVITIISGFILAALVDWMFRFWQRSETRRRRAQAEETLKQHGLTPQLYLATIGQDDLQLRAAMDEFAFSGYLITNARGEVLGKLVPKMEKGPHLRLVVSND